jgi:RNA ligase (TIGR02306 family)
MANKLVYIGKIIAIEPISGADRIEQADVVCGAGGKWHGVVVKGQFQIGDLARVYLQDGLLPQTEEFAFMAKLGYRVRMARFKGVPSECLIMPLNIQAPFTVAVGSDITEFCDVEKYNKPLPASMAGDALGNFPSFIPKTDEPNFQTVPDMLAALRGQPWQATVKCDGSSVTTYWYDGHFGVCSRNLELKEADHNTLWQLARAYKLEEHLAGSSMALQFEIVGPGIQGNPMGLKRVEGRLFNIYDITRREYYENRYVFELGGEIGMPTVEIAVEGDSFDLDEDALRKLAEGLYPNGKQREGIVIRPLTEQRVNGERLSFKVINLLYRD